MGRDLWSYSEPRSTGVNPAARAVRSWRSSVTAQVLENLVGGPSPCGPALPDAPQPLGEVRPIDGSRRPLHRANRHDPRHRLPTPDHFDFLPLFNLSQYHRQIVLGLPHRDCFHAAQIDA